MRAKNPSNNLYGRRTFLRALSGSMVLCGFAVTGLVSASSMAANGGLDPKPEGHTKNQDETVAVDWEDMADPGWSC